MYISKKVDPHCAHRERCAGTGIAVLDQKRACMACLGTRAIDAGQSSTTHMAMLWQADPNTYTSLNQGAHGNTPLPCLVLAVANKTITVSALPVVWNV
jgi:hypothetical protein